VKALVDSGQISLFTGGYWGHPAYHLPPEADLMAVAHYLEALEFQREFIRIHAVLGGKNPHLQTYLVGGMAAVVDPNEPGATVNDERITLLTELAGKAQAFVEQVYIPDVLAIAGFYKDWFGRGEGLGNFMSYGDYPTGSLKNTADYFLPRGLILNHDLSKVKVDPMKVTEAVAHSYYNYSDGNDAVKHPWQGETNPNCTGPTPPFDQLNVDQKYSWLKSPRYEGMPVEVGPLSRMLVAYASGHKDVKVLVDGALAKLGAPPTALFSTLGRVAARALEAQLLSRTLVGYVNQWCPAAIHRLGNRTVSEGKASAAGAGGNRVGAFARLGSESDSPQDSPSCMKWVSLSRYSTPLPWKWKDVRARYRLESACALANWPV
jgi:hydrogenase large subunit